MDNSLRCITGKIADTGTAEGVSVTVPARDGQSEAKTFVITSKTAFMGAVEDKLAFDHLVAAANRGAGLTVNLWVDGSTVKYASPNYK